MDEALLDTDMLSEVLKAKDARVLANAQQYLGQYGRLAFSAITFYEVVRGLVAASATKQLANFLRTAANSEVTPISIPILHRAANLWATAISSGHPRDDADLIIGRLRLRPVAFSSLAIGRTLIGSMVCASRTGGRRDVTHHRYAADKNSFDLP